MKRVRDRWLQEKEREHWAVEALRYASDKTINSFIPESLGSEESRNFFFREYITEYRARVKP